jgi:hypothetical protein
MDKNLDTAIFAVSLIFEAAITAGRMNSTLVVSHFKMLYRQFCFVNGNSLM